MGRRHWYLAALAVAVATPLAFVIARAHGPSSLVQTASCNMSGYKATDGLTAAADADGLTLTWVGERGSDLRMRLAVDSGKPIVRELAIRPRGGQWATLGRNLSPEFGVTTGRRRIGFDQLNPYREMGTPLTRELIEREKWSAFWDAPLEVPGRALPPNTPDAAQVNTLLDLPRKPEEIKRATALYQTSGCDVKTDGARIEVSYPGLTLGVFSGRLQFTVYKGTNLVRQEAIAKTDEPSVAYKYEAGLKGFSTDTQRVRWRDTGGDWQKYEFGGTPNKSLVALRARNRIATVEGPGGSVAVFPPPHKFFFSRETEINLGYVWYRKDSDRSFSVGVRHADREERFRPIGVQKDWVNARVNQAEAFVGGNFALYNAPPGSMQRMAVFYYVSAEQAPGAQDAALRFTHNDQWTPIPGYVTMTTHYHSPFTMELFDQDNMDHQAEWIPAIRARGAQIVMMSDFHADGHMTDEGPVRLKELKGFYEAAQRFSDKDFTILYLEEPHQWMGYHWNVFFPKPVYWIQSRKEGQPFVTNDPQLGKVYRVGSRVDAMDLVKAENGIIWMAHQRTKNTSGYPDALKDTDYFKTDAFIGGEYRMNVPTDLSQKEMCEMVCFDAMDSMNNWSANKGLQAKFIVGATDTYMKYPEDDVYSTEPVNYVKLDHVPHHNQGWADLSRALRAGQFFVTTGEVLIKQWNVEGTGSRRTIVADLDWTFPLDFIEVVWGNGEKTGRQIISASDLQAFGTKHFSIPFDASGKDWVRISAWDVAANGAFTQPVRLSRTVAPTAAAR
jgi:hypothetical protein